MENYWIFHFCIDHRYQGQGSGKKALQLLLQFIKDQHIQCRTIQLTVHRENERAKHLYTGAGFQPTEAELEDGPVYRLTFKS